MAMQFMDGFDHYQTDSLNRKWGQASGAEVGAEFARTPGGQGCHLISGGSLQNAMWKWEFPLGEETATGGFGISAAVRFPAGGTVARLFGAVFPGVLPPHNVSWGLWLDVNGHFFVKRETMALNEEPGSFSEVFTEDTEGKPFNIHDGEWYHVHWGVGALFNSESINLSLTIYLDGVLVAEPFQLPEKIITVGGISTAAIWGSGPGGTYIDDVIIVPSGVPMDGSFPTQGSNWSLRHGDISIIALKPNNVGAANNGFISLNGLPHWDEINDQFPSSEGALSTEQNVMDDWDLEDIEASSAGNRWKACQAVALVRSTSVSPLQCFVIDTDDQPNIDTPSIFMAVPGVKPGFTYDHLVAGDYEFFRWVDEGDNGDLPGNRFRNQFSFLNGVILGLKTINNQGVFQVDQFVLEIAIPFDSSITSPPTLRFPPSTPIGFTKLWKMVREDGEILRFTNHNTQIQNPVDGQMYTPLDSFSTSAYQRKTGIDPNNLEIQGIIGTIEFNDFLAGRYNDAKITEYILDWRYPWAGVFMLTTFYIHASEWDGIKWKAEATSIGLPLLSPKGDVFGRTCRYILGDDKCKVNLDLLKVVDQTVGTITNIRTSFVSSLPLGTDSFGNAISVPGYWNFGNLVWTSGNNAGLKIEIRSSVEASLEQTLLTLQIPTPFDIIAGDAFTITPGCNKLYSTCKDKFENPTDGDVDCGNTKNFGGFPTIPGKDGQFSPITGAKRVISFRHLDVWGVIEDWIRGGFPF